MTAVRHHTPVVHRFALRAVLALLVAVAGLVCAQSAPAAEPAQPSSAARMISAAPSPYAPAQSRTAGDETYGAYGMHEAYGTEDADAAEPQPRCSAGDQQADAPASTRHAVPASATAAGRGAPDAPDGSATVAPGRGGPAPPSPPSLEALSVLRV